MTMAMSVTMSPRRDEGAVLARDMVDTRDVVGFEVDMGFEAPSVRDIYDAEFGRLAGWTTRLVGDPDLAHDLATEAFVKLVRNWSTVRQPRAWLYTTVANLVRDHWRKRGREAMAYERHAAGAPEHMNRAAGDLATTLTVRDAVLALPDRLRVPALLHYFADLSVAQIASQLNKADGNIKRDLYDARARLAQMTAQLEGTR
jgi:RNA polymerase sigma factor (sigma-70 family)